MLRRLSLNMCVIADLVSTTALLSSKDGLWLQWFSLCIVNASYSFLCPPCSVGFVYAEERRSCGGSGVRRLVHPRRAPHSHVRHSTIHLRQGGTGSPVSSFDLLIINILVLPTAHNILIKFIYNILFYILCMYKYTCI